MTAHFQRWTEDPSELLDADFSDIFDREFALDGHCRDAMLECTLTTACQETRKPMVLSCLKGVMKEILVVTTAQLADFLVDGKYGSEPPEDVRTILSHCPLTNLIGENAFGDFDFDLSKRRHCSLHHRTTTHMLKSNKTGAWLDAKSEEQSSEILAVARKKARLLRKKHKQQENVVRMKIKQKVLDNEREKKLKELRAAEQKQRILEEMLRHGGPCRCAKDVTRLLRGCSNTNALLRLKAEIRYQKTVLGNGGTLKLTGRKDILTQSLKRHLGGDEDEEELDITPSSSNTTKKRGTKRKKEASESDCDTGSEEIESDTETETFSKEPFTFEKQGQWVSVFFDDQYYVGQVIEVKSGDTALVKFLEKTKGRCDFFRWPACEDIAEIERKFVFSWDFNVNIHSSDGRVWTVPDVKQLQRAYDRIRTG